MEDKRSAQQKLNDFRPEILNDRHDRQLSLLEATNVLPQPPFRVVDLGCGSGVTAVWAARKGWDVTAIDIAPEHVEVLKNYLKENEPNLKIETLIGNVADCKDLKENHYHIAYLKDFLEHAKNYRESIQTAYKALKKGGLIFVTTTNVICPIQLEYKGVGPYSWYPKWLKVKIMNHALNRNPAIVNYSKNPAVHWFSRKTLGNALKEEGFSKVFDVYDLIRSSKDLTRRTRIAYPIFRIAKSISLFRPIADIFMPGLTMIGQK